MPISLERKLVVSVIMVLLVSLIMGATLTYEHAASKVETEMDAALAVGRRIVVNVMDDGEQAADPRHRLALIVGDFNGDRHLRAVARDPGGSVIAGSSLEPPGDPAPGFFFNLVGGKPSVADIALPPDLAAAGRLRLETDAHNEVSEAWADFKLDITILCVFFCLVLALTLRTLRGALRPLQQLTAAFTRVGAGDYEPRLAWRNYRELQAVQQGFNGMATQLADMERMNRVLRTRVQCVQEDERAELARDLHDEVAPFLFAVSADASLIRQFAGNGKLADIDARAGGILTSVSHMQKHLRDVLSRLMPNVLLDLGLAGAIETLIHFWQSRRTDIEFHVVVDEESLDEDVSAVVFRIVQESLSNAVRHGDPSHVSVVVARTHTAVDIEILDDGKGMSQGSNLRGLGLLGMRERVHSAGGRIDIGNRTDASGVRVHAILQRHASIVPVA